MKEEKSKQGHTHNEAKQYITPKAVTFPKKNELPRVGLVPTTLYTLDRALNRIRAKLSVCFHHVLHRAVFQCTVAAAGTLTLTATTT